MKSIPAYIRISEQIKADWLTASALENGQKLPTQEELAERYGVSRSTIVRVMSRLVAEGYIHSQQGSGGYFTQRTPTETRPKCLSLIVPDLHAPVIVAACRGVERKARQLGYQVLIASSECSVLCEEELVQQHLQSGVQGIVLYPVPRSRKKLAEDYLTRWTHEIPLVAMDSLCAEWNCSCVLFDNRQLGYDLTYQLMQHGYRNILFMHIAPDKLHTSINDRQLGWEMAHSAMQRSIPLSYRRWIPEGLDDFTADSNYEEIAKFVLRLEPFPDAIIAWNDVAAAYLIQALINEGIKVPDQTLVAGFDNEPLITRLFRPRIPTSSPAFSRLGEVAVETLEALQYGDRSQKRVYYLPVPILWREASGSLELLQERESAEVVL